MLALCACGGSPATSGAPSDSTASSSATPQTPPASGSQTETPTPPPAEPEVPTPQPEPTPEPEPVGPVNPLTGLPIDEALVNRKPVAIMLNNIKAAQPQQGNSQADIIYEVLAEGGITRMLGLYQDISQLGVVGSIRSARPYYLELALGHDSVYVHAGGSEVFYQRHKEWNLSTVDCVNGYYGYASTGLVWRDKNRVAGKTFDYEHSMITSGEKLTEILTKRNVLTDHTDGYTYEMSFTADGTPADGKNATTLTVPFIGGSKGKTTIFRYDEATGVYKAEQYGSAYIDGNDGTQVSATNVLVLRTTCTAIDDAGHLQVDLSSGDGWYACGGKYIPITWEKGQRDQPLRYFTTDGQPLTLGQGKSYVCIIHEAREIIAE
ncbi:MAG: DUF3048 domain-containing protein [Ruminococcaceae bacterium]|nr:DUF3048 domain-containing protein [Oscillospiraceae bacterium]